MTMKIFTLLMVLGMVLSACAIPIPMPAPPTPDGPAEVPRDLSGPEDGVEPVRTAVRQALAEQLNVDGTAVEVVQVEPMEWPDACLGLAGPDEMCAQVITPGYRVVVEAQGEPYIYRTDQAGQQVRLEEGETRGVEPSTDQAEQVGMVVRQAVMQQLRANFNEIAVADVESMAWPNTCLGLAAIGEGCAEQITPGYQVVIEAGGERYVYRTDQEVSQLRLAEAPQPEIGAEVIEWTQTTTDSPCQQARIGTEGVAFGLCGHPPMQGYLANEQRQQELADFSSTFAPFEADTVAGHVVFQGEGEQEATAAQQRMIAEWTRLAHIEAIGGRSGASYGLILAWHREGGIAGFCNDLIIYVTGTVYATSCAGGEAEDLGQIRLTAEQLEQIYNWVDAFASFEYEQTDPAVADAMIIRLIFSGAGTDQPTPEHIQEIQDFAAGLYSTVEN